MIEIAAGTPAGADLLAVPVFAGRAWGPGAAEAAQQLGPALEMFLETQDFTGAAGSTLSLPGGDGHPAVMLVGLGEEADNEGLRRAAGDVGRASRTGAAVATTLHQVDVDGAAEAVALGFLLGQYRFDEYKSEPKPSKTERLVLVGASEEVVAAARRAEPVAAAVAFARDLINEPAAAKSPEVLARRMEAAAADVGVRSRIYRDDELLAERFGGLIGVGAGAKHPPRMVELWWEPPQAKAFLALVGKGIVFDSGGLSLKTREGMVTMKTDMSGAAAVAATVTAAARLDLPVRILGIAPLAENMPGGGATHPGDVLEIRNGKTIEVVDTDAEGRLVLADGLALACEHDPDMVVDVATLTGAAHVALGDDYAGLWANDQETAERVLGAAGRAGELVWHMPLVREYRRQLDSDVADMKNKGDRYGGAIVAALLLSEFVDDRPWAHLDIAGPARATAAAGYLSPGGTGFGVRTLLALAEDLAG